MEKGTRIQKVLSDQGVMSRRKAEELIEQGKIKVNGHPAKLGQKINPARDLLTINDERVTFQKSNHRYYVMMNKPRGYVTTMSDELGRKCVAELVKDVPERIYPIGRLDKDSEGLLLLTNDGEFANLIMHPSHHVSKTYRVTVRPDITDAQTIQLSAGVMVDGKKTSPAHVIVLEKVPGRVVLQIVIHEGRNRQVRKLCEAVGLEVARLKRTSIGPVKLGMLAPGKWRELKPGEVGMLRNAIKTAPDAPEVLNDIEEESGLLTEKTRKKAPARRPEQRDRKAPGKSYGDKKPGGNPSGKSYGEKKAYGDKKPSDKSYKKSYGDKPSYGEKKAYGDKKPSDKSYGKSYGDKKPGGNPSGKSYGEKKAYGDKKPGGKPFGKSYGDKKPGGNPSGKSYSGKKAHGGKKLGGR